MRHVHQFRKDADHTRLHAAHQVTCRRVGGTGAVCGSMLIAVKRPDFIRDRASMSASIDQPRL